MTNSLDYPFPNPKLTYRYPFEQGAARQHRKEMLDAYQETALVHITMNSSKVWLSSCIMHDAFGIFDVDYTLNTQPAQ